MAVVVVVVVVALVVATNVAGIIPALICIQPQEGARMVRMAHLEAAAALLVAK
jgi:hypothetical protein